MAAELVAVVLDRLPLERLDGHDHELIVGLLLEGGECRVQLLLVALAQEARIVDHPAGERRKLKLRAPDRRGRQEQAQQQRQDGKDAAHRRHRKRAQKLTLGACSAPALAAKFCFGSEP